MLTRARVLAVAALLSGVVGSYVWLNAGTGHHAARHAHKVVAAVPGTALDRALRYIPANSRFIAVAQTSQRLAAMQSLLVLANRLPGADVLLGQVESLLQKRTGLDVSIDLLSLLGNPIVVAGSPTGATTLSWVASTPDALQNTIEGTGLHSAGTYRSTQLYAGPSGTAIAVAGDEVVAGTSPAVVRAAIDVKATGAGAMTTTQFDARAAGVPRSALVRVVADGAGIRSVLKRLYAPAGLVPWVAALSRGVLALSAGQDGLHGTLVLDSAPGVLTEADLPLAPGARAPSLQGSGGLTIGIRDIAHLGHFLLDAGAATKLPLVTSYQQIDALLTRFAHIDLDQQLLSTLTGSATITTDDLSHINLRAETSDPTGVQDVLSKIADIGRVGGFLGIDLGGYGVTSHSNDLVTITKDGSAVVTLGVRDGALVLSTDPNADFDAIATASDSGPSPARGALRALISPKILLDLLVDRIGLPESTRTLLEPLRQMIVTAQVTGGALTARFFAPVAG